jgi:hypothetical protein
MLEAPLVPRRVLHPSRRSALRFQHHDSLAADRRRDRGRRRGLVLWIQPVRRDQRCFVERRSGRRAARNAGHVEVHGYDEDVAVAPGRTATLSFTATRSGRFPIDLHAQDGAHLEVTALEVMPR